MARAGLPTGGLPEPSRVPSPLSRDDGGTLLPLAALSVAALALVLSVVALVRSGGAMNTPSVAGRDVSPSAVNTGEVNVVTSGTSDTLPNPTGSYTVAYDATKLILRPNTLCGGRTVDLDQPLINATTGEDMKFRPDCPRAEAVLAFPTTQVAVVTSPTAAADCVRAMQLSPASQSVLLSQDLVVCARSDGQGAAGAPQRQKVVRMVVSSIDKDQTTHLSVTAWEVPH